MRVQNGYQLTIEKTYLWSFRKDDLYEIFQYQDLVFGFTEGFVKLRI